MAPIYSIYILISVGLIGLITSEIALTKISAHSHTSESTSALIHFFDDVIQKFIKKVSQSALIVIGILFISAIIGVAFHQFHHGYGIAFAASGIGISLAARSNFRRSVSIAVSTMRHANAAPETMKTACKSAGNWLGIRTASAALLDLGIGFSVIAILIHKFPHLITQSTTPYQTQHEIGLLLLTYGLGILVTATLIKLTTVFFGSAVSTAAAAVPQSIMQVKENDPRNPFVMANMVGLFASEILGNTVWIYAITILAATATIYSGITSQFFTLASTTPFELPLIILSAGVATSVLAQIIPVRRPLLGLDPALVQFGLILALQLLAMGIIATTLQLPNPIYLPVANGIFRTIILAGILLIQYRPVRDPGQSNGPTVTGTNSRHLIGISLTLGITSILFGTAYRFGAGNISSDFGFYGIMLSGLSAVSLFPAVAGLIFASPLHRASQGLYELLNPEWDAQSKTDSHHPQIGKALLIFPMIGIGAALTLALTHSFMNWFHRLIVIGHWAQPHIRTMAHSNDPTTLLQTSSHLLNALNVSIMNSEVWIGILTGLALVSGIKGWMAHRTGAMASLLLQQAQYETTHSPEIWEGTALPDYEVYSNRALRDAIAGTAIALGLALIFPLGFGLIFGIPGVIGLLVAALLGAIVESISDIDSGHSTLLLIWSVMIGSVFIFGGLIVRFGVSLFI